MEKIKNWIKKNKGLAIVLSLAIVLFIILVIIFIELLVGGSSNKYGNRLDGIEEVKINNDIYEGVKDELMDTGLVESAEIRLQGKIVYTTIVLKSDISKDKAKELASATLDNYTAEELNFYDFSYFLKWTGEESDIVITGNKHHNSDAISWIKS
ncbi:MAG: hypothetical protein ACI31S_03375 [Bacilli bacterium]